LLAALGLPASSSAQDRAGQPPVLAATTAAHPDARTDWRRFADAYRNVGMPRIMLFWNRRYDDQIAPPVQTVERIDAGVHANSSAHESLEGDWIGHFRSKHSESTGSAWAERVTQNRSVDAAKQPDPLDPSVFTQIEQAFKRELSAFGMRVVDRDFVIRLTHSTQDRTEANSKLIEADAVNRSSEWLLQITTLPDQEAPLRVGFAITLVDVKSGADLLSFYSRAETAATRTPGHYVAVPNGFELQRSDVPPSPNEGGTALARETIAAICGAIDQRPPDNP
jgi:hypothetical protein